MLPPKHIPRSHLLFVVEVHPGSVLRALVVPLAVHLSWVVSAEENSEKPLVHRLGRVVKHLHNETRRKTQQRMRGERKLQRRIQQGSTSVWASMVGGYAMEEVNLRPIRCVLSAARGIPFGDILELP